MAKPANTNRGGYYWVKIHTPTAFRPDWLVLYWQHWSDKWLMMPTADPVSDSHVDEVGDWLGDGSRRRNAKDVRVGSDIRETAHQLETQMNAAHAELQDFKRLNPDTKLDYRRHPGSILNAYREGDLTFYEAVSLLKAETEQVMT